MFILGKSVEKKDRKICRRGSALFHREHTNETELSLIVKKKQADVG